MKPFAQVRKFGELTAEREKRAKTHEEQHESARFCDVFVMAKGSQGSANICVCTACNQMPYAPFERIPQDAMQTLVRAQRELDDKEKELKDGMCRASKHPLHRKKC